MENNIYYKKWKKYNTIMTNNDKLYMLYRKEVSYQYKPDYTYLVEDVMKFFIKYNINFNPFNFIDMCCAPGYNSLWILKNYPNSIGECITMPKNKKGYILIDEIINNKNMKINIMDLHNYNPINKFDHVNIDCISGHIYRGDHTRQYTTILKAIINMINVLNLHGTGIILFTFKNTKIAFNFYYILTNFFLKSNLFQI